MLTPELQALLDAPNKPMPVVTEPEKSLAELLQDLPPGMNGKLLRQYAAQTETLPESAEAEEAAR